ncbi:MAG: hypothetical protein QM613_05900 [Micrococcaceae bacterium]
MNSGRHYHIILSDTSVISKPEQYLVLAELDKQGLFSIHVDKQVLGEMSRTFLNTAMKQYNPRGNSYKMYRAKKAAMKTAMDFAIKYTAQSGEGQHHKGIERTSTPKIVEEYRNDPSLPLSDSINTDSAIKKSADDIGASIVLTNNTDDFNLHGNKLEFSKTKAIRISDKQAPEYKQVPIQFGQDKYSAMSFYDFTNMVHVQEPEQVNKAIDKALTTIVRNPDTYRQRKNVDNAKDKRDLVSRMYAKYALTGSPSGTNPLYAINNYLKSRNLTPLNAQDIAQGNHNLAIDIQNRINKYKNIDTKTAFSKVEKIAEPVPDAISDKTYRRIQQKHNRKTKRNLRNIISTSMAEDEHLYNKYGNEEIPSTLLGLLKQQTNKVIEKYNQKRNLQRELTATKPNAISYNQRTKNTHDTRTKQIKRALKQENNNGYHYRTVNGKRIRAKNPKRK